MKIALVHEHLAQDGGAEKVLHAFQELYPDAPIYTLVFDRRRASAAFREGDIRTSMLQRLPFGLRRYKWYLPLMPTAVEQLDLSDYDVVLSSSSAFAKGVLTLPRTLHICYCHSPTRYLWSDSYQYVQDLSYGRFIKSVLPLVLTRLRVWDRAAADRVDTFIANSKAVQARIAKYYRRSSAVIYPPVDTNRFSPGKGSGGYYLIGGRLVPYKRYDLAVTAFNKLGLPLKVFGTGPEFAKLRRAAKPNIEFLGNVAPKDLPALYAGSIAFLHPQEEDFGITAVEAMASGRPVIAYAGGGALETVIEGKTGSFFAEPIWEALADTIIRFRPETFAPEAIRAHALQFDTAIFKEKISSFVEEQLRAFRKDPSSFLTHSP